MGSKIDIIIFKLGFKGPFFGHVFPELIAMGRHFIFNSSYILAAPFLKGVLSSEFSLVPCGKIINGLFDLFII